MVEFKIYRKKLYNRIAGIKDEKIREAETEINKYLEEGWRIINITADANCFAFLIKD